MSGKIYPCNFCDIWCKKTIKYRTQYENKNERLLSNATSEISQPYRGDSINTNEFHWLFVIESQNYTILSLEMNLILT